jgi:TRAP-type C4-dicarboxylate transport system permease small subunit
MLAWGALIVGLLAFTALAFALFRALLVTLVPPRISALGVIALYWLLLALSALLIWLAVIQVASYLYATFPVLWVAAWDVGLVWVSVIGACISIPIGFAFGCGFTWRAWAHVKSSKSFTKP